MKRRSSLLLLIAGCAVLDAAPAPQGNRPVSLEQTSKLDRQIRTYLDGQHGQRTYIQTDKPLYQPGETIWFRADIRATRTLTAGSAPFGVTMQLVSPRGAVVQTKRVLVEAGIARNDFQLAPELEGGEYTLQLVADSGAQDQKKVIVNTYEAPRLMKTLELTRKAYGAGDPVAAALEIKRQDGTPYADHAFTAVVTLDDAELARLALRTDHDGKALVQFELPAQIARGDGLLTVLAEDGGVTESIQKRIPIVMTTLSLGVFPEGGDLVAGVPGRVYFMAKTTLGKPADVEGNVVDDRGTVVTHFTSIHDGMGRFELAPEPGRSYHLEITRPANITTRADVPAARPDGCVLRAVDSPSSAGARSDAQRRGGEIDQGSADTLRIAAICKTRQHLAIEATLREKWLAGGGFVAEAGKPALVELPVARTAQGAVRVTLFSAAHVPLAERLVYHGEGANLNVTITPDRKAYSPRDRVRLHVHATDAQGRPVKANVALAVVDDTVLSYADDKSARILAHLYLEPELGATAADPIEEPNFYFSDKPEAKAAMDALLATRGYRHFEWRYIVPAERSQP